MKAFVIAEHDGGQLKRVTLEAISELARQGVQCQAIVMGHGDLSKVTDELKGGGATKIIYLEHESLKEYSAEGFANASYAFLSKENPDVVVAGAQGKDFMPRLAAKFGVAVANDCTSIRVSAGKLTLRRPVYAGKCSQAMEFSKSPALLTLRPNVVATGAPSKQAIIEKLPASPGTIRTQVVERMEAGAKKVELTEADIIISGGRSLKNADNFKILHACAQVIGAAVGASRAAVDAGYAPHAMQVGQTGKTVSPKLYIACGISGAIQHLAGMRTSKVIVAINKDPEAPIFQKSDYGIVGDLFEVVPLLTEELKKLKAQG